ncbi:MAG: hypothetical protein ACYC9R_06445 [Nitrosotalea sp.]
MIANMQQRPLWMRGGGMGLNQPATGMMPQHAGSLMGGMGQSFGNPYMGSNPWAAAARFAGLMGRPPSNGMIPSMMGGSIGGGGQASGPVFGAGGFKPAPQMPGMQGGMGAPDPGQQGPQSWGSMTQPLGQIAGPAVMGPTSMPTVPGMGGGMMSAAQAQANALAAYTRRPQGLFGM